MKKSIKKICLCLSLIVITIVMSGCGKSDSIIGTWENNNDGVVNDNISYKFNRNNTGTYKYYTDKIDFTYEDRGNKVVITMNNETIEHDYSIKDGILTLKDSYGENVIYKKKTK